MPICVCENNLWILTDTVALLLHLHYLGKKLVWEKDILHVQHLIPSSSIVNLFSSLTMESLKLSIRSLMWAKATWLILCRDNKNMVKHTVYNDDVWRGLKWFYCHNTFVLLPTKLDIYFEDNTSPLFLHGAENKISTPQPYAYMVNWGPFH